MSFSCQTDNETNDSEIASTNTLKPTFDEIVSLLNHYLTRKRLELPLDKKESRSFDASVEQRYHKKRRFNDQEPKSRVYERMRTYLSIYNPCHRRHYQVAIAALGEEWATAKFWYSAPELYPENFDSARGEKMERTIAEIEQHGFDMDSGHCIWRGEDACVDQATADFNPAIEHPAALSNRLPENTVPYYIAHPASMFSFPQITYEMFGCKGDVVEGVLEGVQVESGETIFDWNSSLRKWTQGDKTYADLLSHLEWHKALFDGVLEAMAITVSVISLEQVIVLKQLPIVSWLREVSSENWKEWGGELGGRPVRIATGEILQLLRTGRCAGLVCK